MSGQTFIRVSPEDFDLSEETARIRAANPQSGAIVSFVGVVRNKNDGSDVAAMSLEHYPGMTEKALGAIIESARSTTCRSAQGSLSKPVWTSMRHSAP